MNEKERVDLLQSLKPEQRKFLEDNIKQLKCDLWVEKLAKLKGITITDDMDKVTLHKKLDEWILVDILDGGYKKRPYKCKCGKSLRNKYILKNRSKDITIGLGQECLKKYTKLDEKTVSDIIRRFHKVNSELDEILARHEEGIISNHIEFLAEPVLPPQYKTQIKLGLPLSKRQELKVKQLITEYYNNIEEQKHIKELEKVEEGLSISQKEFLNTAIEEEEKHQLIIRLKNGDYIYTLEDVEGIKVSDIAEQKIHLNLPLNYEEEKIIKLRKLLKRNKHSERESEFGLISKSRSIKKKTQEIKLDYQTICNNHGELIKHISHKQHDIPESLRKDWSMIEAMIKDAELGSEVSRRQFLLMLSNIATSVGIYANVYDFYR